MTTLRPRDKIALGVVASLLVVVVFYFVAIAPQRSKVSNLNASIATQLQTVSQDQAQYASGRAAQISLRVNRSQWEAVKRAVPAAANIPGLLRILQRNANSAHVTMQSVDLTGANTGVSATPTVPTSGPTAVPVSLTFSGSYQNLERLMRELDGLVVEAGSSVHVRGPLVSVGSVSLAADPKGLNASVSASIYEANDASTAGTSTTSVAP
jgi:Tfp pilus assembly protein PilO